MWGEDCEEIIVTFHRTFSEEHFRKQQFAQKAEGNCETNISKKNCLGTKESLGGECHLLQRTQEDKSVILPQELCYGWRPQS